jgi:TolB protein
MILPLNLNLRIEVAPRVKMPWLVCLLYLLGAVSVPAQLKGKVEKAGSDKSSLDWSAYQAGSGPLARVFIDTLKLNLSLSGCFINKQGGLAEYKLIGRSVADGATMQVDISAVDPTNDVAFGKSYQHRATPATVRALAQLIADEMVEELKGQKGVARTKLAIIGSANGKKELYICDADGQGVVQITSDKSISLSPQWGNGPNTLFYTSYLMGYPDVYRILLSNGKRARMANYPGMNTGGALSPGGRQLALVLSKDGKPEIYVKNLNSNRLSRITNTPMAPKASPCWTPDGRRLILVSGHRGRPSLYSVNARGGKLTPLPTGGVENIEPDVGADGRIVFSTLMGRDTYGVKVFDPKTGEVTMISPASDARLGTSYESPSWSSNGRHIVCIRKVNYRSSVVLLDTLGDPPIALLEGGQNDWSSPDWSP